jgi:Fe-S cluster assembly protein SufD
MIETPHVVIRTRRGEAAAQKDFTLKPDSARLENLAPWITAYRRKAWEAFQQKTIPTTREDAWRRTDLKAMQPELFRFPTADEHLSLAPVPETLLQSLTGQSHGGQIVLKPGGVQANLDADLAQKGVVFTDLASAEEKYPQILEKILGKVVDAGEGKFAALASALAQNGILLYVPKGVKVEQPLHSLLWGPGQNLAYLSHLMVYLEEGSAVTYVHEASSPSHEGGQNLHAGVVEIFVGSAASLRFVELQSWGDNVWNFSHERVKVERDGNLEWIFGAIGSHLTKNFSDLDLVGEGSTGKMSGFYFTDGNQHLDHDTQQNHFAAHSTSDLLFKGALLEESRSVWQGMIYVAPGSVKADGYQANRNLVLSRKARADSIPGLEILTDDVRCTHGATVGKIDADQTFYLVSRGIPKYEAEKLIVEGFFDPIMQRIPFEGVRQRFQEAIHNKMDAYKGQ